MMPAEEFRAAVHHDVCSEISWPSDIRGCHRIVHKQPSFGLLSYLEISFRSHTFIVGLEIVSTTNILGLCFFFFPTILSKRSRFEASSKKVDIPNLFNSSLRKIVVPP